MSQKPLQPKGQEPNKGRTLSLQTFLFRLISVCVLPLALLGLFLAGSKVYVMEGQRNQDATRLARNIAP